VLLRVVLERRRPWIRTKTSVPGTTKPQPVLAPVR
jgi:hypothetical protein